MPTYSYRCDTCGHEFDASQKFSDEPLKECPECSASIRRVIQPVGVVFKGSGWYITDSRGPNKEGGESDKPAAKKDSSDGKEAAPAKESAKETSTPAAASADKPAAKAAAD
jgi:putative FmdB family regulatory protein